MPITSTLPPITMRLAVITATAAVFATLSSQTSASSPQNMGRVPMDSLRTLYFKDGHQTTSRRGKALPQIACTGNSRHICDTYGPQIAVCQNLGGGAWKCEADLHHSVRFGVTDVSCEGWTGPNDEYVLRGSCMLRYTLLPNYAETKGFADVPRSQSSNKEVYVFFAVIAAIFLYFYFKGRSEATAARAGTTGRGGGGGGGGGGGPSFGGGGWGGQGWGGWGSGGTDPSDPPPPYPKAEPGTRQAPSSSDAWRPGFWTGLAGGVLGAEAARRATGGRQRATQSPFEQRRTRRFDDDDGYDSFGRGGSNSFGPAGGSGGGGSSGGTRTAYGYGSSNVR